VSPDGSRFLLSRSTTAETNPGVTIVQNWFAEFANRVKR
jgi:hypothetical protein